MYILGISAYYHDAAAALLKDGKIIGAAQEERFSRIKHDSSLPMKSAKWLLEQEGITIQDVDYLVFHENLYVNLRESSQWQCSTSPFHGGYSLFKCING